MINKIIWIIAISLMVFSAVYFSIKLRFPQLKVSKMLKKLLKKEQAEGISTLDTLMMSLANKIGVGSLAGISLAIYLGGPGAIFYIWIITIVVSINTYLESGLAVMYKEKDGPYYRSGPSYYIKNGLKNQKLSMIYSLLIIFAYIFCFLTIQTNTISVLTTEIFNVDKGIISIVITALSGIVIFKGLKVISNVCSKIVPLMAIVYLSVGFYVILTNFSLIPSVFKIIITDAIGIKALGGGVLYAFYVGLQKSIFATEAGLGTGAIAAGAGNSNDYIKQGYVQVLGIYFIGLIITTITAIIILTSNYQGLELINPNGIELTKYAFNYHLGDLGNYILLIVLVLFAFSTIITGYYYGESSLKSLTNKGVISLKVITIILLFIGGIIKPNFIWEIVNISTALLAIINIYSIYKLRDKIVQKM